MGHPDLYAEDIEVGVEVAFGSYTLTEDEIIAYASQWDPLPIHVDPLAAKAGPFGAIIASGLHTLAVYQRLMVSAWGHRVVHKAGKQLTTKFRRPVLAGTTLTGRIRVLEVEGEGIVLMRPPEAVDGVGRFATVADPQGGAFAIIEPPAG